MNNTKHLINSVKSSVNENLIGLVSFNSDLQLVPECSSVVRKDIKSYVRSGKVLLISGGKYLLCFEYKLKNLLNLIFHKAVPVMNLCLAGLSVQVY